MKISYSESMVLRGLAILMMIWLHCFNKDQAGDTYISIFHFEMEGVKLPYLITKITQICVSLYCFLSGYGLFYKYPYTRDYTIKKNRSLVKQYWFVLTVFMVLAYLVGAPYSYTIGDFFANYIGYDTTWNTTLWFLLPYVILLLTSNLIFNFINRYDFKITLPTIVVVWIIAMIVLKEEKSGALELNPILRNLFQVVRLLLPFCLGAFCKKYENLEVVIYNKRWYIYVAILLFMSRFLLWNHFALPFYCLLFVYIIHGLRLPVRVQQLLEFFGRKSLYLWFCHAYFVYYFLREYTYCARYAIFIYLLAIIYSLLSAIILEYVYKKLKI